MLVLPSKGTTGVTDEENLVILSEGDDASVADEKNDSGKLSPSPRADRGQGRDRNSGRGPGRGETQRGDVHELTFAR